MKILINTGNSKDSPVVTIVGVTLYVKEFKPEGQHMDRQLFKEYANLFIDAFQDLIDTMPDTGMKESNSQKLCLQGALHNLERNTTGLTEADFNEDDSDG